MYESQAESLQDTENESVFVETEEGSKGNNELTVSANELKEETLTKNNLNAEEDDFSNLKYNNEFNYKFPEFKSSLTAVSELKDEARTIKEEGDVKLNEASNTSNKEEKKRLTR